MDIFVKYAPEIILFIYVLLFFMVKQPNHPHDRVIISDGKSYYGYLTAIFIYNDLSYSFIEDYESKYYPDHPSIFKEFRYKYKGKTLNKGFPGLAFLLLPFFLIAHLIALLCGLPADGYSLIYQYFMGFSALFYFWVGLRFTRKMLAAFSFNSKTIAFILFLIAFATNIIYYTLKEGMMTHVYNFGMLAAFLFYIKSYFTSGRQHYIVKAALLFGLIVATRPTNGLFVLLIPFVAGSWNNLKQLLKTVISDKKLTAKILIAGLIFPFATALIWYVQTGFWIVWSYGEEGFNFLNPQFFKILFSFNRGWFIYTPLALVSLTGFIWLYRHDRFRFVWGLFFMVIFVYVASSWWVWTYTSNFGQRTFIDLYAFIALLLAFSSKLFINKPAWKIPFIVFFFLIVALNSLQFYQHYTFVFPPGQISFNIYKDSFFRLKPLPKVYYPEGYIVSRQKFFNDFEKDYNWLNFESVTDERAYEGRYSSKTGLSGIYSIGLYAEIDTCFKTDYNRIRVSSRIFSDKKFSSGVLVIQLDKENEAVFYQPFFMKEFSKKNRWSYVEVGVPVPDTLKDADHLRVYFHNEDKEEEFFIDNLQIELLSLSIDY